MLVPHPIPYQGSKRILASAILSFFPPYVERLVERFAGSGGLAIATANHKRAECNSLELFEPLSDKPLGIQNGV